MVIPEVTRDNSWYAVCSWLGKMSVDLSGPPTVLMNGWEIVSERWYLKVFETYPGMC